MGQTTIAILTDQSSQAQNFVKNLLSGKETTVFKSLDGKNGLLFSRSEIERYMDQEERHDIKILTKNTTQSLKSMSSGEQKKALLNYLITQQPDFLVLVNPFDNLDTKTRQNLRDTLCALSESKTLVQLVGRLEDILPVTTDFYSLNKNELMAYPSSNAFWESHKKETTKFKGRIPQPMETVNLQSEELVNFNNVSVSFDGRQVLDNINWNIKQGEFWQLIGPNGSGKTTLLSMITGDSHKGYGQKLSLFGLKKGSGESVWDLKQKIGYFTPAMIDKFRGYHTLENMIISGLHDSIGLYVQPTDTEKRLAHKWLELLSLSSKKDSLFKELSMGEKRLVMTARAMIKHPPLLILDEPTAGLDDKGASLFVSLVNKISRETTSAIIFVSHRKEIGLHPEFNFVLEMKKTGSVGKIIPYANT
ncbi:ATP-binding cassette domain-containing protein [Flagellimonas nanhaiensis]|uniref:ATP-binding cassette domain-containing protein n=1 Tax=Flagellimonas nanhaiensis TaxID=2292706 RepID=A0A371JSP0_9FLAO|nr:ATP-binding cassette domain-containing protein [Allomuricauda nanhaiensis]RDY60830.1 ATP-binding cassette domain-containing protein [Allomuricauda nanhaiensis]